MSKPYYRTIRQFVDGQYAEGGRSRFIRLADYAPDGADYVRGFQLIQKDLITLFEYVEPADANLAAYSFRTYELLLRACTELEANFKSIFRANTYSAQTNLSVADYHRINATHFVSDYEVKLPYWHGAHRTRRPFAAWSAGRGPLPWYNAYSKSKHDRGANLAKASLEHLIDAVGAVVVVLSAQFYKEDFSPAEDTLVAEGWRNDGMETAIGGYFRVKFPQNIPIADRYDFTHHDIKPASFLQKFDYNRS